MCQLTERDRNFNPKQQPHISFLPHPDQVSPHRGPLFAQRVKSDCLCIRLELELNWLTVTDRLLQHLRNFLIYILVILLFINRIISRNHQNFPVSCHSKYQLTCIQMFLLTFRRSWLQNTFIMIGAGTRICKIRSTGFDFFNSNSQLQSFEQTHNLSLK